MPPTTPELSDPRTYVSSVGIVELQFGVENSTVEWQKDLYNYVREDMYEGQMFDPNLCTKDKETGQRYWFACVVCPCNLYKDEIQFNREFDLIDFLDLKEFSFLWLNFPQKRCSI